MYRTISIIVLIATFGGIAISCIVRPYCDCWRHPCKSLVRLFTMLFVEQKLSLMGMLRKLVFLLALVCFVVLAFTGLWHPLVNGQHIEGYMMMIHATFAPIFAICLAVLAIMWARNCCYNACDWPWLQGIIRRATLVKTECTEDKRPGAALSKTTFWLIVVLSLPLIMSIVLSMLPLAGTHWQHVLMDVHRYVGILFAAVALVHLHLMIRLQMRH